MFKACNDTQTPNKKPRQGCFLCFDEISVPLRRSGCGEGLLVAGGKSRGISRSGFDSLGSAPSSPRGFVRKEWEVYKFPGKVGRPWN